MDLFNKVSYLFWGFAPIGEDMTPLSLSMAKPSPTVTKIATEGLRGVIKNTRTYFSCIPHHHRLAGVGCRVQELDSQ